MRQLVKKIQKKLMYKAATAKIGPYFLGKTLGVGSFGKVKLGEHEICEQKVAIKILNRKKIQLLKMGEKVRREINVLRISNHPHIIRLFEVINTSTDIYVITEYITGGELFDYIAGKGRLCEDESRRFFQQMISGIEYCHKHQVIHRDLKPENLLLDAHYNIKIADFGLSNIMHDGFLLRTSCGSPNYAAPEVIIGNSYLGPEVDVWSCGIILFALICGSLPFDDEKISNLYKKIQGGVFSFPNYVSDSGKNLINQILTTDPLKRITMEGIRKHPWFQIRLPRYLSFPSSKKSQLSKQILSIDDNIVEIVSNKTKIGKSFISLTLKKNEKNSFTVIYYLIRENITPFDLITIEKKEIFDQKKKITKKNIFNQSIEWPFGMKCQLSLGIKSFFLEEPTIMCEIFRAIKTMGVYWKNLSKFYIEIFVAQNTIWNKKKKLRNEIYFILPNKIGIHLYKHQNFYLVDFHRIDGDIFSFLFVCDKFKNELKIL
jgi:5'-AMP-activated protein kinase catalytic alpha subunit